MVVILSGLLLFILIRDASKPTKLTLPAITVPVKIPAVLTPNQVNQLQDAARTQDEVLARAQALVAQLSALLSAPIPVVTTTTTTRPTTTNTTTGSTPTTSTSTSTTSTSVPNKPLDGICQFTGLC